MSLLSGGDAPRLEFIDNPVYEYMAEILMKTFRVTSHKWNRLMSCDKQRLQVTSFVCDTEPQVQAALEKYSQHFRQIKFDLISKNWKFYE